MARRKEDGTVAPAKAGGWQPDRMTEQKTKLESGGNSRPDREWIEAIGDEGFHKFQKDPRTKKPIGLDDCPWDVNLQFQGYAEEVEPEWFDDFRRGTRRCTGIAYIRDERGGYILDLDGVRLVRPCLAMPMNGSMVCQKHGGQLGHVKEAAQRRLTHAAEKAATTLITLTDVRDEEGEIVEQSVRIKAANSVLDRVGIKAGSTVEMDISGFRNVMDRMFGTGEEEPGDGSSATG
jgi:hypothetical protein